MSHLPYGRESFIVFLYTKFNIASFSVPLIMAVKLKDKNIFHGASSKEKESPQQNTHNYRISTAVHNFRALC
jgi:hypothetical protein